MSKVRDAVEGGIESILFASRWLLAPLYLGLVVGLVVILGRFVFELYHLVTVTAWEEEADKIVLGVLGLLDIALLGNLILIVIFAGYENFVSKIGAAEGSEDRPHWMGHVDFSGLKIKLIGSLVAISVIELLQDFMQAGEKDWNEYWVAESWRVGLHLTFVISGVLFAIMDWLADKRKIALDQHQHALDKAAEHQAPSSTV